MSGEGEDIWIYWWSQVITFGLSGIIATVISIIQTKNTYQDLFTKERLSIQSNKNESKDNMNKSKTNANLNTKRGPKVTLLYKTIAIFVVLACWHYTFVIIFSLISKFEFGQIYCYEIVIWDSWNFQFAKMYMYLVFITRLHIVYKSSAYAFKPIKLKIISIFIIIICFVINIITSIVQTTYSEYYQHKYIPSDIGAICKADTYIITVGLIVLLDMTFAIGTIIVFLSPLRKIVRHLTQRNNNLSPQVKRSMKRLMAVGRKFAILAIMAMITTISLMVVFGLTNITALIPLDFLTNQTCMVLMTPYYKDDKYFDRFCCGIIKCSKCCCHWCCWVKFEDDEQIPEPEEMDQIHTLEPTITTVDTQSTQISSDRTVNVDQDVDEVEEVP